MNTFRTRVLVCTAIGLLASMAYADVFNMGGTRNPDGSWNGLASLETVPVGNPRNAADTEVMTDGTTGYGSVSYSYNIGKYEVTAGQYCEFLNKVAVTDTHGLYNTDMLSNGYGCKIERTGLPGGHKYRVAEDFANRPVNFVSWGDAARFANWLHNGQPTGLQDLSTTEDGAYLLNGETDPAALLAVTRKADCKWAITSEDEWYKAAYYNPPAGTYYNYPTGSNSVPSNQLIDPDPGNNATYDDHGFTIGNPYFRTEVGAHENSDSPYGTFDQGGNVWELNEAVIDSNRGMRGGSWGYPSSWLHPAARLSYIFEPDGGFTVGFRVSEVPEPCSAVLLALGALATLRRRSIR